VEKYGLRDDLMKLAIAGINDSKRPLLAEVEKKQKSKIGNRKSKKSQTMAETVKATEDAS
jgi:hypothetical protein